MLHAHADDQLHAHAAVRTYACVATIVDSEDDRGNKLLDEVMDTVTANVPAMAHTRKHVDELVQYYRSANRSHFRSQVCARAHAKTLRMRRVPQCMHARVRAERRSLLVVVQFLMASLLFAVVYMSMKI